MLSRLDAGSPLTPQSLPHIGWLEPKRGGRNDGGDLMSLTHIVFFGKPLFQVCHNCVTRVLQVCFQCLMSVYLRVCWLCVTIVLTNAKKIIKTKKKCVIAGENKRYLNQNLIQTLEVVIL